MYGVCHCGCREVTHIARWNVRREGVVAGDPRCFVRWHHRRVVHSTKLSRHGMPAAYILSELRQLVVLAGSQAKAARRLGWAQSYVGSLLAGKIKFIRVERAHQIAAAVRGTRAEVRLPETERNTMHQRACRARQQQDT